MGCAFEEAKTLRHGALSTNEYYGIVSKILGRVDWLVCCVLVTFTLRVQFGVLAN